MPDRPSRPQSGTVYDASTDRTEKVTATLQALEQGIASLADADSFKQFLTMMSRFHQYSFGNIALILAQRPDAVQVAGYRTWQALGRQVKRGEKGLSILVPHKVKIEPPEPDADPVWVVRHFGIGYVWDVRQTQGKDPPRPPLPAQLQGQSAVAGALYRRLEHYVTEPSW
jgi:hypothetical protein